MRRRISPEAVRLGMYVQAFGGSWFDHPFWRPRFVIGTEEDLERVRTSGVPWVEIDEALGEALDPEPPEAAPAAAKPSRLAPKPRPRATPAALPEPSAPQAERRRAIALVDRAKRNMRRMMEQARLGQAVRTDAVLSIVDEVSASVERNPRTLLGVIRLKSKDEYTYLHSVAVCTLMVNTARFLGKGAAEQRQYGLAGLLHDIGKMGVPDEILNKPGSLTDAEFATVRGHPEFGHRLLSQNPDVPELALDVCLHHHEKLNGTGYPHRLGAEAISEAARLGAICDVYDALTSDRAYKAAWTPDQALGKMWSWEGHFDRALLFAFMQSIEVFPPGMLVRLRSNRLGVVRPPRRPGARPRVTVFHDLREGTSIDPLEIVVKDSLATDSIVAPAYPEEHGIAGWDELRDHLLGLERAKAA